jgi:hypothetical protein
MKPMALPNDLDHLVYAVPDLTAGVAAIAALLGVTPSPGGPHPGLGTRNYLVSLGKSCYLEIIGPDPEQPQPARPRPFGLDRLPGGRLVTWAIHDTHLERRVEAALAGGFDPGPILPLSRQSPAGLIEWRLTMRGEPAGDGLVPFVIDWGKTPSPALSSTRGCTLRALRAEHPDPKSIAAMRGALGTTLDVAPAAAPALVARIATARGEVELR